MTVKYMSNGKPERIPAIGARFEIKPHLLFEVESYGETKETPYETSPTGLLYEIELHGKLIVPAGSPIEVLEDLLGEKL